MIINPIIPAWLLFAIVVPMTLSLLWLEWRRRIKHIGGRLSAVCIMMIAFTCICLRPAYTDTVRDSILLLTSDYNSAIVDSLLRAQPDLTVRHVEGVTPYRISTLLSSSDFATSKQRVVAIAGEGLPTYVLEGMGNFQYYPGTVAEGFISLFIPPDIRQNKSQAIDVNYYHKGGKVKIYLESPAGKEDSTELKTGENIFKLAFTPKHSGKVSYTLTVGDATRGNFREHLPLYVNSPSSLNILIIQGYPSFEVQVLKNFLQRKDHRLAIRSQLSRRIFRYEFANRKVTSIERITGGMLNEFDLVILDSEAISGLSASERSAISVSVDKGLGMLTLLNTPTQGSMTRKIFPYGLKNVRQDSAVVRIGSAVYNFPAVAIRPNANSELIGVTSNGTGMLAGYTRVGSGHIGFQLLQETYRLILSGDSTAYGILWSPLIEQVAKPRTQHSIIIIDNQLPCYIDEPIRVRVISRDESPALRADSLQVALREDPLIDGIWATTVWHSAPGWHALVSSSGDSLNYYVSHHSEWRGLRRARQRLDNGMFSNRESLRSEVAMQVEKEYPKTIFYLAFMVAAGGLWLAPKL